MSFREQSALMKSGTCSDNQVPENGMSYAL
jgi:hypothetical protein